METATISTTTCSHPILRVRHTRGRQMSDPTLPLLPFRNLLFPYGFCVVHFHLLVSRKGFGATNQRKDSDLDHLKEDLGLSVRCVSHRVFVYPRSWRGLPSMCWRWQEKERTNTACRRASASKWRTWKFVSIESATRRKCCPMWVFQRQRTPSLRAVTCLGRQ